MSSSEGDLERPNEAEKLDMFLGDWRVDGTMEMEGNQAKVSGIWEFAKTADGWGVVGKMDTQIEGIGSITEAELIGFDSEHGNVHLFSMNRLAVRDHVGTWKNEATLVVEYRETHGSKQQFESITIDFGSEQIKGTVEEKVNGTIIAVTDITLTRL